MADDDDGTVESVDRLDQRLARIDVQMVRRLVEQQDMGPVSRHQREQQARLLASGQAGDGGQGTVLREAEPGELRADLLG